MIKLTKPDISQSGYKAQTIGKLDPLYEKQWYLYEKFGINITPVWKEYLGDGVIIEAYGKPYNGSDRLSFFIGIKNKKRGNEC